MRFFATRTTRGFSLIELMVAVAVVATLVAAATPLYRKHAQHLRHLDGRAKLLEVMDLEHRYYARELVYTGELEELGLDGEGAATSARGHYRLSVAACEADLGVCVRLTATPERDTDAVLTLDSRGRRTPGEIWR